MKRFLLAAALAAISAIAAPGSAQATTIDFETVDQSNAPFAPLLADGDYVTQGGYYFQGFDNSSGGGGGSLIGALINGADAGSCLNGICPSGNATNYIGALNDGVIVIGKTNGESLRLLSFDAAFLATPDEPSSATSALLAIYAERADGTTTTRLFNLGPLVSGTAPAFQTFQTSAGQVQNGAGTLTSDDILDYYVYAFYCSGNSCHAFSTNKGQFALDNLVFADDTAAAVPETATWAMMVGGFGMIGATVRRKKAKATFA